MANPLLLYFLPLQWALYSRVQLAATKSEQLSALDHLVAKGLQEGNDIQEDESLINLSMIMTNMAPEEAEGPESVFTHLDLYLISLLTHSTKSSRFRLLIISDATLAGLLRLHLKTLIGKELSRRLIHGVHLHFPHLRIHLVNIETIVAQNQDLITQMKPLFSKMGEEEVYHPGDPGRKEFEDKWMLAGGKLEELEGQVIRLSNSEVVKYSHDLFYIAPFYHLAFPNLDHLIATDLDIEFRSNIEEVFEQFRHFSEHNLLGAAPDPSPMYMNAAKDYLEWSPSKTILGQGGDFPGLNTGVVLFNLTRMRRSKDLNDQLNIGAMRKLLDHFRFNDKCMLGDQDWFTLLSWRMPECFYQLPCAFNYVIGWDGEKDVDLSFRAECSKAKIIHRTSSLDKSIDIP